MKFSLGTYYLEGIRGILLCPICKKLTFSAFEKECCVECKLIIWINNINNIKIVYDEPPTYYFNIFRKMNNVALYGLLQCKFKDGEITPIETHLQIVKLNANPNFLRYVEDKDILVNNIDRDPNFIFYATEDNISIYMSFS